MENTLFGREPVLYISVVKAAIEAATAFGLALTENQELGIVAFVTAILSLVVGRALREKVTPSA